MVVKENLLSFGYFLVCHLGVRTASRLYQRKKKEKKKMHEKHNVQCMQHRGQDSDAQCLEGQGSLKLGLLGSGEDVYKALSETVF